MRRKTRKLAAIPSVLRDRTAMPAPLIIPARPSALTARQQTANTIPIINATRIRFPLKADMPKTMRKRSAAPLSVNKDERGMLLKRPFYI